MGRELQALERSAERLVPSHSERQRLLRMAAAAREDLAEAMSSAGRLSEHIGRLRSRS